MAGALGHEITKVTQDLAAHFFVHVIPRLLKIGFECRIQIPAAMLEAQKPGHVIDAGSEKINLFFADAGVAGDEVHRGLDSMTKTDELEARHASQRPAAHRHRVRIIKENGFWTELLHI